MKAIETNLFYATACSTIGGTALEKRLKNYVWGKYHKCVIEDRLVNVVLGDIQQKAKELLAANPRCKGLHVNMGCCTGNEYWINSNAEAILTFTKVQGAYTLDKEEPSHESVYPPQRMP